MGNPRLLTPRILWAALLVSQVIYFVLIAAPGLFERDPAPPDPVLLPVLGAVALSSAIGFFVLPMVIARGVFAGARIETRPLEDVSPEAAAYRSAIIAAGARPPAPARRGR